MAFYFGENPDMDIAKIISINLTALMDGTPALDTIKKVEQKSGVGFGTIRRAKKGDANITVEKLTAIAQAFKRHPAARQMPCFYFATKIAIYGLTIKAILGYSVFVPKRRQP